MTHRKLKYSYLNIYLTLEVCHDPFIQPLCTGYATSEFLKQLAAHFNKAPELINEQEIKDYFLYNRNVKHWSRAAFSVSISAIKFFFEKTLQRKWHVFGLVRPPRDKSLPVILSLKEVNKIFSCIKMEHHKACLKTTCLFF